MTGSTTGGTHLVVGGFPPGSSAGHDHDHVRLKLLAMVYDADMQATVANDYADIARWLPVSRLLVTYTAGPYPDAAQCRAIDDWLHAGGHWLALHGTTGGRAERVEGQRQRRTVKTAHHALVGSRFLIHPPIRRFRVEVRDADHPLTRGLPPSFDIEDEPYFIELQDPGSLHVLITADYGPDAAPAALPALYPADTSLLADGRSRALGYVKRIGAGHITYLAFGHCHSPAARAGRADDGSQPAHFRRPWENDAFIALLRNAIAWRGQPL